MADVDAITESETCLYPAKLARVFFSNAKINVLYGGRSAGKSESVVRYVLSEMARTGGNTLILRMKKTSIRYSIYGTFRKVINGSGYFSSKFDVMEQSIRLKDKDNSRVEFMGIYLQKDGLKGIDGYRYYIIDEAVSLEMEDGVNLMNTLLRHDNIRIFILFNPRNKDDYVYNRFITNFDTEKKYHGDNLQVQKICWKDNNLNGAHVINGIKADKAIMSTEQFNHVWGGELYEAVDSQIFKDKWRAETFDTPHPDDTDYKRFFYGVDWGYSRDPTVMTRCYIKDGNLYIDYEACGYGVELVDLPELFSTIPGSKTAKITADNSGNSIISYLKSNFGYDIVAVDKWPNSVNEGIAFMRSFKKIIIHTRCKHTIEEFRMYSYKTCKSTGDIMSNQIIDSFNHCIDSIRYALSKYIAGKLSDTSHSRAFVATCPDYYD